MSTDTASTQETESAQDEILTKIDEDTRVAVLTLNAPQRRNALTLDMASALTEAISELESSEKVGAIVITGNSPAFCAGADLSVLRTASEDRLRTVYGAFLRVASCKVPTIAAINGPAVGAGVNLAISCDLRLISSEGRIDLRFLRLGIHPGGGCTWLLRRLLGPQGAAALLLFGQVFDAQRCLSTGLVWECTEPEDLMKRALEVAGTAAAASPEIVRLTKETLGQIEGASHAEAVEIEIVKQLWSLQRPEIQSLIAVPPKATR